MRHGTTIASNSRTIFPYLRHLHLLSKHSFSSLKIFPLNFFFSFSQTKERGGLGVEGAKIFIKTRFQWTKIPFTFLSLSRSLSIYLSSRFMVLSGGFQTTIISILVCAPHFEKTSSPETPFNVISLRVEVNLVQLKWLHSNWVQSENFACLHIVVTLSTSLGGRIE